MSAAGLSLDLPRELRVICGDENVTDSEGGAHVGTHGKPVLSVAPASAEEVTAILRLAHQRRFTLSPGGGETEPSPGFRGTDVLLQTRRLTQIEHYDHADLTVGIGAGMTVAQLAAMVGADNLMFGCDPPLPERATIGGVLAAAKNGPMRHGYGSVRDFCIGVRFVTGDGRTAKGGGRVVKNVAGYDMMKLLIGSYGTLAVITSASFKLFPAPRRTVTFLAEFGSLQEALRLRDVIMHSPLAAICLELVSPRARKLMRPTMTDEAWVICIRAAGSDAVLSRYRKELGSAVTREVAGEDERVLWTSIEDFPTMSAGGSAPAWDCLLLHVPPAEVEDIVAKLDRPRAEGGLEAAVIGRVAVGALVAKIPPPKAIDIEGGGIWERLGARAGITGSLSGKPLGTTAAQHACMRAVKQALDPNNVLGGRELF